MESILEMLIGWLIVGGLVYWFAGRRVLRWWRRVQPRRQQAAVDYNVDVVGESFYQDALERICGQRTEEGADLHVDALLVPEPNNPKDKNAIRVTIGGKTVGYLSRADALIYRQRYGSMTRAAAANIRGGWRRRDGDALYGVRLSLPLTP